jgi:hypothetical protein
MPNLAQAAQVSSSRTPSWTMSTSRTRSQRSSSCPMLLLDSAKPCCQSTPKICAFNPNQMNQSSQSGWKWGICCKNSYMSNLGNSRFPVRFPHVCEKMLYGKFGGIAQRKMTYVHWYDITFKGVSLFGKVPSLTFCLYNSWKPMSVP